MWAKRCQRSGVAWLELLLVLAFLAMLFQVFPGLWVGTLWALDIRNWSRGAWLCVNIGVVLVLFGIRFGPDLYDEWRQRRKRHAAVSPRTATSCSPSTTSPPNTGNP